MLGDRSIPSAVPMASVLRKSLAIVYDLHAPKNQCGYPVGADLRLCETGLTGFIRQFPYSSDSEQFPEDRKLNPNRADPSRALGSGRRWVDCSIKPGP